MVGDYLTFSDRSDTLAIKDLAESDIEWMLRATLIATDHGMLLTGLNKGILAVNRRFGEIFGVSPSEALSLDMEPLRAKLRHLVVNPDSWMKVTNATYENPERIYEDTIELYRDRRIVLKRHSAPVRDANGVIIGRLWTYLDITAEHRLIELNAYLQEMSRIYDPNPEVVLKRVLDIASKHYDNSNAILSLTQQDQMFFRIVVGPNKQLSKNRTIPTNESYCQFALSGQKPIIIQDARLETETCKMNVIASGLTRYLGVPIVDSESGPVGTLCIVDDKSNQPLDDIDIQFMSVLAMRVSSELARERHTQERLAEKEDQIRRQKVDLMATNAMFEAMNHSFKLLAGEANTESVLRDQTRFLVGLLGYSSAAVLMRRNGETKFRGFSWSKGARRESPVAYEESELPEVPPGNGVVNLERDHELAIKLRTQFLVVSMKHEPGVGDILICLGRTEEPPLDDRHRIHLEAMVDHVCLLLAAHLLQAELSQANSELQATQTSLLQKEKLSVVGTLAASTAHDIRNITASLGLLATPGLGSPEQTLEAIREQLSRFDILAHRLLSYAKPRLVAKEPVCLHKILGSVSALTESQANIANVRVVSHIARELPPIMGDPYQLEHLFVNLILNAVQSMDRTGGTLTIKASRHGSFVQIRLSDTGPGIKKEIEGKLFEPFSSSRADGFGLGLYSCRRIVEAHGGTIRAKSTAAQGTTFTIELPIEGLSE